MSKEDGTTGPRNHDDSMRLDYVDAVTIRVNAQQNMENAKPAFTGLIANRSHQLILDMAHASQREYLTHANYLGLDSEPPIHPPLLDPETSWRESISGFVTMAVGEDNITIVLVRNGPSDYGVLKYTDRGVLEWRLQIYGTAVNMNVIAIGSSNAIAVSGRFTTDVRVLDAPSLAYSTSQDNYYYGYHAFTGIGTHACVLVFNAAGVLEKDLEKGESCRSRVLGNVLIDAMVLRDDDIHVLGRTEDNQDNVYFINPSPSDLLPMAITFVGRIDNISAVKNGTYVKLQLIGVSSSKDVNPVCRLALESNDIVLAGVSSGDLYVAFFDGDPIRTTTPFNAVFFLHTTLTCESPTITEVADALTVGGLAIIPSTFSTPSTPSTIAVLGQFKGSHKTHILSKTSNFYHYAPIDTSNVYITLYSNQIRTFLNCITRTSSTAGATSITSLKSGPSGLCVAGAVNGPVKLLPSSEIIPGDNPDMAGILLCLADGRAITTQRRFLAHLNDIIEAGVGKADPYVAVYFTQTREIGGYYLP